MRQDPVEFRAQNEAPTKTLKSVIKITYETASIHITSHAGLSNVPGTVIQNVLQMHSAISQRIVPDEGRSEIGSMSFTVADVASAFTNAIRTKLDAGAGLRDRLVELWIGYDDDFENFQLFQTQEVRRARYENGVYSVECEDITRTLKKDVFEPKTTTLRESVSATATTIPVQSTTGFELVLHGTSWSDAPSSSVGYIKIDKEWVRYTGKTADTFTGCTRGVLNTRAVAHEVDAGALADRRPKVEEGIYLELPAVKLAYAILTGELYGNSASLPAHWHLGIDPSLIRTSDFTGIGTDLWDPASDSAGFVARFIGLKKTDAKRFLESELFMLLGCFSPVYSDGALGLRRMNQIIEDAAPVVTIDERNAVGWSSLAHEFGRMHNVLSIDWNWNGDAFTRRSAFVDAGSIAVHGRADPMELKFKGLSGARHTDSIISTRLDAFRDRFAAPPVTQSITLLYSLNRLEVGDVIRNALPNVRDFTQAGASISRAMEVQRASIDFSSGDVTVEVFGSTGRASVDPPTADESPLPDAFYTAQGVALSTVCTINDVGGVGVIQAGTYNLAGNASLTNAGAVYYYDGDLELASGATLTVNNNVQIRVKGFFTINGTINGVGRGQAGVASSGAALDLNPGLPGYVGNTRGMDGVRRLPLPGILRWVTAPAAQTLGKYPSAPLLSLEVDGNALIGLPADLRGTSGGGGGKASFDTTVIANGGAGSASGAGLAIICRGMGLGASASINLSGANPAATSIVQVDGADVYPGAGGAGGPGTLYILLDGSAVSIPDLGGKFTAATGVVPVNGNPLPKSANLSITQPAAGYLDPAFFQFQDLSNACYRIQYVPAAETPEEDGEAPPPAPTSISASGQVGFVLVSLAIPPVDQFDVVEVWASIDNDRTNATKIAEGLFDSFVHTLPGGATRYYWARTRKAVTGGLLYSAWTPTATTTTASGTATSPSTGPAGDSVEIQYSVDGSTGWHSTFTAGDLYMRQRVGTSGTWSAAIRIVGEQGAAGPAGHYIDTVFRRSATQPATPTGDNPSGWSDAPPAADGNPLWFSQGEKTFAGVLVGSWSTPVQISGNDGTNGTPGANAVTAAIVPDGPTAWVRGVDQTTWAPTATTVDLDCTFYQAGAAVARRAWRITRDANGLLTGATTTHIDGDLNTTRVTVTEINEGTLSMGVRFAYSYNGDATSITGNVVSTLSGSNGADGLSVAELTIYRRAASAPATPTGGSFNFGTQALTQPASWSVSVPAGTDPVYVSTSVAATTGASGTDSTLTWSAPVLAFQNGTNGTNGADGQAVDMVFKRSASQPATPSPSAGVPATWYTNVNSVPADSDPMWSSVGTRPNPSSNYTWQTPVKVESDDGRSSLVPDPSFERSAGVFDRFWSRTPAVYGSVVQPTWSLETTGGLTNAKAVCTFNSSGEGGTKLAVVKAPLNQGVAGELLTVTVRWRRTNSLSSSVSQQHFFPQLMLAAGLTKFGVEGFTGTPGVPQFAFDSGTVVSGPGTDGVLSRDQINARTVHEWQQDVWVVRMDRGAASPVYPVLGIYLQIYQPGGTNAGTLEFDYINVTPTVGTQAAVPQKAKTSAYTLSRADIGQHISITTGGVTVPSGVFQRGDAVTVYNNSASNQTITQGASTTLRLAGTATTGNRTLAQRGLATILCVAANEFAVVGAGVT